MIVDHTTAVRTGMWGHCSPRAIGALALAFSLLAIATLPAVAATHALVVGVGRYADASIDELKADVDAEVVAAKLKELGASVTQLLNEEATKTAILGWFSTVRVQWGDLVYIYLAGHGGSVPDVSGRASELGAFYPYDVKTNTLGGLSGGTTADSAITENDLTYGISERLKGCHVVVFLDSCKSGLIAKEDPTGDSRLVVRGEGAFVPRGLASGVRDADDPGKTFVFASSDEHEPSFEDPDSEPPHGLFTRSVLNGLVCDADIAPADGTITYGELKAHVIRNMAELSESPARRGYLQTPVVLCSPEAPESESFALAQQACQLTIRSVGAADQSEVAVETPREEGDEELVVFPDPALDRAVRKALRKGEGEPITKGECRSVRWLIAVDRGIISLEGLEALTGLTNLDLGMNGIGEIGQLAGLAALETLSLRDNQIMSVQVLGHLLNLRSLDLSGNSRCRDITDLVSLRDLETLQLAYTDLHAASRRTLAGMGQLRKLGLCGTNVTDLQFLAQLTGLQFLDLTNNYPLDDLAALAGLVNLRTLALSHSLGGMADISPLAALSQLVRLECTDGFIADISPLTNLTRLTELKLGQNRITDVAPLAGLTGLKRLNLSQNRIVDIAPLAGLTGLYELDLSSNQISSITPLAGLTGLGRLHLSGNRIVDIAPLAGLTGLYELGLGSNQISSITPLAGLTGLKRLYLSGNRIADLHPLVLNTGLGDGVRADLSENLLCPGLDGITQSDMDALKARGVVVDARWQSGCGEALEERLNSEVTFRDPALEGAVRAAIGKPTGVIVQADVGPRLDASSLGITDLTGLECFTRLRFVVLNNNRIVDLTPLSGLMELESLELNCNEVADIAPLAGLTGLTRLHLSGNRIVDIAPLAGLTGLYELHLGFAHMCGGPYLRSNRISSIAPLAGLTKLTWLELSGNKIIDLTPLAGVTSLSTLELGGNRIIDLTPLVGLTDLRNLDVSSNEISDLTPLSGLMELESLSLYDNEVADIAPLAGLTKLTRLGLSGNKIIDLAPLAGLTKLRGLGLSRNKIIDLTPLAELTEVDHLWLDDNKVADIAPLAGLTGVDRLYLSSNEISDLSPLAGLTGVDRLDLRSNEIIDLSPLAGLTGLTTLRLDGNKVADVTPLAGLTWLTELYLARNEISDITPLAGLAGLQILDISDNAVRKLTPVAGLTLRELHISGNPSSLEGAPAAEGASEPVVLDEVKQTDAPRGMGGALRTAIGTALGVAGLAVALFCTAVVARAIFSALWGQ